tara:strand:+ start:842 stop:961 length:120 start_codon:yes stop_codon:yes gene_type:complete
MSWLEPLWVIGGSILVFYGLSWFLENVADFLGIEEEDLD